MNYMLVKSLHIGAVIFWIGGMLLQALLLLAARSFPGPTLPLELSRMRMLVRWDRLFTVPAMLLAWISGLFIATQGGWLGSPWLSVKLAFVVALSALHGMLAGRLRRHLQAAETNSWSYLAYVLPGLFAMTLAIVFLVTTKPF
jgi:protoporphyrinogen IX oxidase